MRDGCDACLELAKYLLNDKGANPNTGVNGLTPLKFAVEAKRLGTACGADLVELLLQKNAHIPHTGDGWTEELLMEVGHWSANFGLDQLEAALKSLGQPVMGSLVADVDARATIVQRLKEAGVNVTHQDEFPVALKRAVKEHVKQFFDELYT